MVFYFNLMSLDEKMVSILEEVERKRKSMDASCIEADRREIEKSIERSILELMKCKNRVLDLIRSERKKLEKRGDKLEKKIESLKKASKKAEERKLETIEKEIKMLERERRDAIEEIDLLKSEFREHIPDGFLELFFVNESLSAGGDYFSVDMKNLLFDISFSKNRKKY